MSDLKVSELPERLRSTTEAMASQASVNGTLWSEHCSATLEAADKIASLTLEVAQLKQLLGRVEPHLDAIVCYASDMGEHEPNRIAADVRAALKESPHVR